MNASHDQRRRPHVTLAAACAAVALLAAACAGATSPPPESPGATGSPTSPEASEPASAEPTEAASPSGPADLQELSIEATDFAFDTVASAPAGPTRITLSNGGEEEHQAQFARIAEGSDFDDLVTALQQPDPSAAFALLTFSGGPNGVAPGEEQTVASNFEPGAYALICFIASPDGVPHFAKGMITALEVTEPPAEGELPEGEEEITLEDFSFDAPDTIPSGEQTISVTNDGPQPHEATIIRLQEGVSAEDIEEALASGEEPEGPPPWTSAGGIAAISDGDRATMTVDLEPGDYAFICFVPDPATGKPHAALGMVAGFSVE